MALTSPVKTCPRPMDVSVATGQRIQKIRSRLGQSNFSEGVKANYSLRCCFPGCTIDDPKFLIDAHIARWADSADFRGRIDNGLCFCLMHDRAFEDGYFTLDEAFCVVPLDLHSDRKVYQTAIKPYCGHTISQSNISPSIASLQEHWKRHGHQPTKANKPALHLGRST